MLLLQLISHGVVEARQPPVGQVLDPHPRTRRMKRLLIGLLLQTVFVLLAVEPVLLELNDARNVGALVVVLPLVQLLQNSTLSIKTHFINRIKVQLKQTVLR